MHQRMCSWPCFDNWATYYLSHGHVVTSGGAYWCLFGVYLESYAAGRALLIQARQQEIAGRLEDAARTYELVGMQHEAGSLRQRARRQFVTQVQVDLNALIAQLRQGGLVTTYRCPACQSPIQISGSTPANALHSCAYCGSTLRSADLAEFLSRIVGAR